MLYCDGMCTVLGHYTDVHSITYTGRRSARSTGDDDGHYSDIHSIVAGHGGDVGRRESTGHYQDIDVDRMNINSADVVNQLTTDVEIEDVRRSRSYEGLDQSFIAALRQASSTPHHYSALAAAAAAESTGQADAEMMAMSQINADNNLQDTVSHQLCISFLVTVYCLSL